MKGSVSLALKLKISTLVAGMTIVSFATSAPELLVSLGAALKGHTDITFGNVIGSNIANIALVLGLAAVLFRLNITSQTKKISFPFLFLSCLVFGIILYFRYVSKYIAWSDSFPRNVALCTFLKKNKTFRELNMNQKLRNTKS